MMLAIPEAPTVKVLVMHTCWLGIDSRHAAESSWCRLCVLTTKHRFEFFAGFLIGIPSIEPGVV